MKLIFASQGLLLFLILYSNARIKAIKFRLWIIGRISDLQENRRISRFMVLRMIKMEDLVCTHRMAVFFWRKYESFYPKWMIEVLTDKSLSY